MFTIFLILLVSPLFGQNHYLGVKSGINISNVEYAISIKTDKRIGFSGGLTYEYEINQNYNFGIDFLYSERGFMSTSIFTDDKGNPTGEKHTLELNYNYFLLPIKGGYSFGEKVIGFANIGLIPSYLIDAYSYSPAIIGLAEETTTNLTNELSRFNLDGLLEIGAAFKFGKNFSAFTSIEYQYGLTPISKGGSESINFFHRCFSFSAGLKYALKHN